MSYLILQSLCITTIITTTLAASIKDKTKSENQPDIEEFINRLLASDKFEKLAEKIAEKAADRIITLQKESSKNGHAKADAKKPKEVEPPKPRSITSQETKQEETDIKDFSDEKSDEIDSNNNKTNNSEKEKSDVDKPIQDIFTDKSKIDTIAAIQKFSEFPPADLSLNYKHFTIQEKSELTSAATKTKSKKHHKSSHKKKSHKNNNEKKPTSKSHLNKKTKKKTDDSDLSIDERKESGESKKRKNFEKHTAKHNKHKKSNEKVELDKEHSESTSSQSDESISGSNENKDTTTTLPTNKNEGKYMKDIFRASSDDKSESETNELNMPDFLSKVTSSTITQSPQVTKSKTIAFGYADTEKSSQESESTENRIKNIADASKLDEKLDHIADVQIDKNVTDQKGDFKDINKIDIKHKIREQNGKFYAFAESTDYDEYHEKLKKILQSVKDKRSSKRKMINRDLLDLI